MITLFRTTIVPTPEPMPVTPPAAGTLFRQGQRMLRKADALMATGKCSPSDVAHLEHVASQLMQAELEKM